MGRWLGGWGAVWSMLGGLDGRFGGCMRVLKGKREKWERRGVRESHCLGDWAG